MLSRTLFLTCAELEQTRTRGLYFTKCVPQEQANFQKSAVVQN